MVAHMLLDQFLHQAADRAAYRRHQLERFGTVGFPGQLTLDSANLTRDATNADQQLVSIYNYMHRIPPYTIWCAIASSALPVGFPSV